MERRIVWIALAALAVALLSLTANVYLLWQLKQPERWAGPLLTRVLRDVAAEDPTVRYRVRLPAGTPVRLDIPINERFSVRVDTQLFIDTRVRLPIRSPLGNYSVSVPVRSDIPLKASIPLEVRDTFRLRTQTQDEIVLPLEVRVRDLPLDALIRSLKTPPP
jgi:hypothetical protein